MNEQLSLLGPEPRAPYRRHSPASREGAEDVEDRLDGLQRRVLEAYRRAGEAGLIDEELERAVDRKRSTVIPRRHELAKKGLVTEKPVFRREARSGVKCGVYQITEKGRQTK